MPWCWKMQRWSQLRKQNILLVKWVTVVLKERERWHLFSSLWCLDFIFNFVPFSFSASWFCSCITIYHILKQSYLCPAHMLTANYFFTNKLLFKTRAVYISGVSVESVTLFWSLLCHWLPVMPLRIRNKILVSFFHLHHGHLLQVIVLVNKCLMRAG